MLIFIHNYFILKKKKFNNNFILINNFFLLKNIKKKIYIIFKYINTHIFKNYINFNILINLFLNFIFLKKKSYFLTSKNLKNKQKKINYFYKIFYKNKITNVIITDKKINKNIISTINKYKLPIILIFNKNFNKKYFNYHISIKKYTNILEFLIIEIYIYIFLFVLHEIKLKNKNIFINKNILNKLKND